MPPWANAQTSCTYRMSTRSETEALETVFVRAHHAVVGVVVVEAHLRRLARRTCHSRRPWRTASSRRPTFVDSDEVLARALREQSPDAHLGQAETVEWRGIEVAHHRCPRPRTAFDRNPPRSAVAGNCRAALTRSPCAVKSSAPCRRGVTKRRRSATCDVARSCGGLDRPAITRPVLVARTHRPVISNMSPTLSSQAYVLRVQRPKR